MPVFTEKNSDEEKKETTGAVLVAISIPIFTSQLEKSREATDAANLRAAYAEASAAVLSDADGKGGDYYVTVNPVQTVEGFKHMNDAKIGTVELKDVSDMVKGTKEYVLVKADGTVSISTTKPTGATEVDAVTGAVKTTE